GLGGKHGRRLVLRLPAEPRDGAVIAAAVGMAADAKRCALARSRVELAQNLPVLNGINQAQPEHLERDAERQIARRELGRKVRLRQGALGKRWIRLNAGHHPKLMYAAVGRAVRIELEADFPDRAELLFE